jgi:hypothetical protein
MESVQTVPGSRQELFLPPRRSGAGDADLGATMLELCQGQRQAGARNGSVAADGSLVPRDGSYASWAIDKSVSRRDAAILNLNVLRIRAHQATSSTVAMISREWQSRLSKGTLDRRRSREFTR